MLNKKEFEKGYTRIRRSLALSLSREPRGNSSCSWAASARLRSWPVFAATAKSGWSIDD